MGSPFDVVFEEEKKVATPSPFDAVFEGAMKGGPGGTAARDARAAGYQQGYGEKLVERASKEIGKTSYVWGGCKPGQTDCSGFTQGVAKDMGFDLPRTAQEQFKKSTKVSVPEAGDYVFMKTPSRKHAKGTEITHVGIYDGKGNLIHNSSSKKGVVSVPLSSMQKYVKGYGRIGDFEKGLGVTPYEERAAQDILVPKKEGLTGAIKAMKMLDDLDAKKEKEANALIKRNAEVLGKKQFAAPNDQNREDRDRLYAEAESVGLGEDPILFDTIRNMNKGELALMVTTGNMPEGFPEIGKYSASAEKAQRFALNQLTQKMGGSSLPGQLISGVLTSPLHIASEVQTLLETGTASYSTGDKAKAAFNIALGVGTADLTFPQGAFGPELLKVLDNEIAAMTKAGGKNVGKLREARQMLVKGYEIDERGTIKKVADFLGIKSTPNPNTVANLDLTKEANYRAGVAPNPGVEFRPKQPTRQENPFDILFKEDVDYHQGETPKLVEMGKPVPKTPKADPPKVDTATPTVVKETPKKPETVKEPWEMTRDEWQTKNLERITPLDTDHPMVQQLKMLAGKSAMLKGLAPDDIAKTGRWALNVEDAIKGGKPVPEDTLRDYMQVTGNDKYGYPPKGKRGVWFEDQRYAEVSADAAKGKPVPTEVLADYPDLVAKYAKEPSVKVDDAVSGKFQPDQDLISTTPDGKLKTTVSYRGPGSPGKSVVFDKKSGMQFEVPNERLSVPGESINPYSAMSGIERTKARRELNNTLIPLMNKAYGDADNWGKATGATEADRLAKRESLTKEYQQGTLDKIDLIDQANDDFVKANQLPQVEAKVDGEVPKAEAPVELTGQARIDAAKERIKSRTGSGIKKPETVKEPVVAVPLKVVKTRDAMRETLGAQNMPDTPEGKREWIQTHGEVATDTKRRLRYVFELSDGQKVSMEGVIRNTNPELWSRIKDNLADYRNASGREKLFNALPEDAKQQLVDIIPVNEIASKWDSPLYKSKGNPAALQDWLKENAHPLAGTNSPYLKSVRDRIQHSHNRQTLYREGTPLYISVEQALKDGKPVGAEVLADYPDLVAKYAKEPSVKVDDAVAVSPKTVYHGSDSQFKPRELRGDANGRVWFASSAAHAKEYGVSVTKHTIDEEDFLEIDFEGKSTITFAGNPATPSKLAEIVDEYNQGITNDSINEEMDYLGGAARDIKGLKLVNINDPGKYGDFLESNPRDVYVEFGRAKKVDVDVPKVDAEAPKADAPVELTGQARIDAAKERIKSRTGSGIKNKSAGAVSPITKEDWQRLGDNIQDYLEIAYGHIENGVTKIQNLRNALIKDGIPENEALLTADLVTGKSMPRATKRELAKRGLLGKLETSKRVVVDPDNMNPINIDEKIRLMNTFTKDQAKRGGDILTPEDYEAVRMFAKGLQNDLQSLGERSVKGEDVSTEFSDKFLKYMEATTALEYSASARGFALNQVKTRTQRYKAKAVYEDVLRVALKRDLTKEERQFAKQMAETVAEKETKWIAAKKSAQTTKHLDAAVTKIKSAPKYSEQQVKDAMKRLQQDLVAPVSSILGMGAAGGGRGFDDIIADLRIVLDPVWTKVKSFGELFDHARPLIHESQMADEDLIDALQTIVGNKYRQAKMSKAWGDDFLQEGKDLIQDASIPEYKKDIENIWQDAQKLYDLDDPNNYDFYDDFGKKMADAEALTDPKAQRKAYGKIAQWLNTGRLDAEDFLIRGNSGVTDPKVAQARLELDDAINKAEMMLNQSYKASWPEKISTWMDLNKLTDPQNRVVDLLSGVHFFADLPATTIAKMSDRVLSTIGFTPSMSFLSVKDKIEALKNIKLRSELAKSAGTGQVGDVARNKVVFTSKIGKAFETSVKKAVSSMDVIPRATARPYVERELATLWAKKEGMTTADALGYRVEELLNDTPPELRREIEATIDEVNFSADNLLSQLKTSSLQKLNSIVKNESKSNAEQLSAGAAYVLLNATFGFTRVFSNIAQYSLEYAGGGLVPAIRGSVMAGGIVKRTASRVKAGEGALFKLLKEEMGNVPASQMRKLNVAIGRGVSGTAIAAIMGNIFYDQKWLEPQTVDAKRGIIDYGFWEQMPGPFKAIVEQCRLRFLSDQLKGDKPGAEGAITVEQYKNLIGQPRQDDLDALNKIVELREKGTITEEEAIKRFKNQMVRPVSIPGVTSLSPKQALEVMMSQPLLTNMAKITNQRIEEVEDYLARQSLSALPLSGAVIGAQRAKDQGIPFIGKYIGLKGDGVYSRRSGNFVESAMKRIPFLADKFPSKANAYSIFGVKDNDPLVKELQLLGMTPQVRKKQIKLPSGVRTSEATKDMDARVMDYLKQEYEALSIVVNDPEFKKQSLASKKATVKKVRARIRERFEEKNKEVPDLEE